MVAFNAKLCRGMAQVGVAMNAKQRGKFNSGIRDVKDRDDLLRKSITDANTVDKSDDQAADDQILAIVSDPIKKILQQLTRIEREQLPILDGWQADK